MASDVYELMYGRHSTDNCKIIHHNLSGQLAGIGNNTIIPDFTIMCDMHISHDQTIIPDFSYSLSGRTSVYSSALPNRGIIANLDNRFFSSEFEVLRNGRNHCTREDFTIFSDARTFQNCDIRTNSCSLLNDNILINRHKWLDDHVIRDLSFRMNIS